VRESKLVINMTKILSFVLLVVLFTSCNPKVVVQNFSKNELNNISEFVVINDTLIKCDECTTSLGKISVKDGGFTLYCEYETVLKLAVDEAKKMGGNCLYITKHLKPTQMGSSCHRIESEVYYVKNPDKYFSKIEWKLDRKLKIRDFRADTINRPFTAATSSSFEYKIWPKNHNSFYLEVKTLFFCDNSYFKRTYSDEYVLEHEQLHFDISEIFARKLFKELAFYTYSQLIDKHQKIAEQINKELIIKQDEYDSEVYKDSEKQIKWNNWVNEQLKLSENYSNKSTLIKK
jgi:hypothetical protein